MKGSPRGPGGRGGREDLLRDKVRQRKYVRAKAHMASALMVALESSMDRRERMEGTRAHKVSFRYILYVAQRNIRSVGM
jgi:hypothetical protein